MCSWQYNNTISCNKLICHFAKSTICLWNHYASPRHLCTQKERKKKTTLEIWQNLNVYICVNNTQAISNNISFNTTLWIFMTLHCDIWTLSVVITQKNNYSYCTSFVKFIKVQTQLLRSRYTCNVNSKLRWNWTI